MVGMGWPANANVPGKLSFLMAVLCCIKIRLTRRPAHSLLGSFFGLSLPWSVSYMGLGNMAGLGRSHAVWA